MKGLFALAAGMSLSASLIVAAHAAPMAPKEKPKQAMSQDKPRHDQGIQNSKKVMKSRLDRDKKMAETRKQAQAKKHQVQNAQ